MRAILGSFGVSDLQRRIATMSRLIDLMQELSRLRDRLRRATRQDRKPRRNRRKQPRSLWSRPPIVLIVWFCQSLGSTVRARAHQPSPCWSAEKVVARLPP